LGLVAAALVGQSKSSLSSLSLSLSSSFYLLERTNKIIQSSRNAEARKLQCTYRCPKNNGTATQFKILASFLSKLCNIIINKNMKVDCDA